MNIKGQFGTIFGTFLLVISSTICTFWFKRKLKSDPSQIKSDYNLKCHDAGWC